MTHTPKNTTFLLLLITFVLIITACGDPAADSYGELPEEVDSVEAAPDFEEESLPDFEYVEADASEPRQATAQVDVHYPGGLTPSSSDTMQLTVYVPERLVSLDFVPYERVALDPNENALSAELEQYTALIQATRSMYASAESEDFSLSRTFPANDDGAVQPFSLELDGSEVIWVWRVKAPSNNMTGLVTLRVHDGAPNGPVLWTRDIQIQVQDDAGQVNVTTTQQPENEEPSRSNILWWVLGIGALLVAGAGGAFVINQRSKTKGGTTQGNTNNLSPQERAHMLKINEALLDAFDAPALERMLRFGLGWDLEEITLADNLAERVYDIVDKAQREGQLNALIEAAHSANDSNRLLNALWDGQNASDGSGDVAAMN